MRCCDSTLQRKHVCQYVIETAHHFRTVLLESFVPKRADRSAKASNLRVNPGGSYGDGFSWLLVALVINHFLCDTHNFGVTKVSGVGDEDFVDRVNDGFFDDVDMFGCNESLGPLGDWICLAEESRREKTARVNRATYRILG